MGFPPTPVPQMGGVGLCLLRTRKNGIRTICLAFGPTAQARGGIEIKQWILTPFGSLCDSHDLDIQSN